MYFCMYTHTYSKINWKGKSQPHDTMMVVKSALAFLYLQCFFSLNKQTNKTKIGSKH